MKSKKSKPLTIRQQIQQCPLLTPEERSLALFGLRKAPHVQPMWNNYKAIRDRYPDKLNYSFEWISVSVVKGARTTETENFWYGLYLKIEEWKDTL